MSSVHVLTSPVNPARAPSGPRQPRRPWPRKASPRRCPYPASAQLAGALVDHGFHPGAPRHVHALIRQMDANLCAVLECPRCRAQGLEYRPYTNGSIYRVVAVCAACSYGEEW